MMNLPNNIDNNIQPSDGIDLLQPMADSEASSVAGGQDSLHANTIAEDESFHLYAGGEEGPVGCPPRFVPGPTICIPGFYTT